MHYQLTTQFQGTFERRKRVSDFVTSLLRTPLFPHWQLYKGKCFLNLQFINRLNLDSAFKIINVFFNYSGLKIFFLSCGFSVSYEKRTPLKQSQLPTTSVSSCPTYRLKFLQTIYLQMSVSIESNCLYNYPFNLVIINDLFSNDQLPPSSN